MDNWKDLTNSMVNAFDKRNQKKLRKINDELLKASVVGFTKILYQLAVLSYVLSKIISKPRFLRKENEDKLRIVAQSLQNITKAQNEDEGVLACNAVHEAIKSLEKDDPRFLTDLVTKGRLKIAATVYAQGVSLGTASEMTGMDKQEIMDYAGKTMMFDRVKDEKSVEERVTFARKLIRR